jgi:hypothetical protein
MGLKGITLNGAGWIHLAQDAHHWQRENCNATSGSVKFWKFPDWLRKNNSATLSELHFASLLLMRYK